MQFNSNTTNAYANYATSSFQASYKDATIYAVDAIPTGRFEKEKLPEDGGCKHTKLFVFTPVDSPNTHYQYIVKHCNQDAHITPRRIDKHSACFDKHINTIIQFLVEQLQSMSTSLSNYTDVFKVQLYTPFQMETLTPVNTTAIKRDGMKFPLSRLLVNLKFSLSNEFVKQYTIPLNFNLQNQCTTPLPVVSKPCEFTCLLSNFLYAIYKEPIVQPQAQNPFNAGNNAFNAVPQQQNAFGMGNNAFPQQQQQNPFNAGNNAFQQQAQNPFNAAPQQPQANAFGAWANNAQNSWANAFKK
jgi:hypothetical protein